MTFKPKSFRPFIGAKNFETSRSFYRDMGFEEFVIDAKMSVFHMGSQSFFTYRIIMPKTG